MNRTFMRSTNADATVVTCSWYDRNGRRCRTVVSTHQHENLNARQTDDQYGYIPYAHQQGYDVVDDAPVPHPSRLVKTV